ncbi:GNAT family N-acetyltransferase [Agrobacterium vitis]|nr:GNAT family N-acetyltransferase [Agrobacterium vitis]MCF1452963.1 acetyltransferase [Agrobacterium vitis]MUO72621.1 GNAT family N-acetyltransferase [Agrobacterium vitis]MUO85330.1 GNAT family N-acetyltransferase [Agrobacterium vitis]MVA34578.1 GNAT family N-acetyltransferase [Agrobacterium vitis]
MIVIADGDDLRVERDGSAISSGHIVWSDTPRLIIEALSTDQGISRQAAGELGLGAMIESVLTCHPDIHTLAVDLPDSVDGAPFAASGLLLPAESGWIAKAQGFFQQSALWLGHVPPAYPDIPVMTNGILHPMRPPKPVGPVYSRFIPWLDKVLGFHVASPEADLPHFHRWMNDPRVAAIWEDNGTLSQHRNFLENRLSDPRTLPLIGTFDGVPFGYFELYWAKEDRLGPHYDADSHDRGWHVAIGEDAFRGKPYVSAWLPSLMHYMFLADPRTRRIVGEPIHHHHQQIRNLDRSGFAKIKHVQFSHKKALLVMLLRERFFADKLLSPDLTGLVDKDGLAVLGSLARGGL